MPYLTKRNKKLFFIRIQTNRQNEIENSSLLLSIGDKSILTGYPLKLHFQIPCVFPVYSVRRQFFPVPIYVICYYFIHKTDLADLSVFKKKILWQILKYLLPIESRNLQLEQTKFLVFWQNFQIPCVFPDRDFFGAIFPVFPVQWVLCIDHLEKVLTW